jgi:hypothetical protein
MTVIPFPSLILPQNSRISRLKQVIALTLGLIWLCGFAAIQAAHAEAPPTGTLTAVPTDGKSRGIQIRSQTVDTTIQQTAAGLRAETILWVKFSNPGKRAVVAPVALGGPQLGPRALPEILDVTVDNRPVALDRLEPLTASKSGGAIIAYTLPITVPLRGSATLRVRYSQALAEQDGLVTFTYPITATARWSGTPESLRMTLKFIPPMPADQVLSHAPAALRNDRDGYTWHWDGQRPKLSVGVAFLAPAWWGEFLKARAAAAAPSAGLAEHLGLSRFYRQLAELPAPAFENTADFYGRYAPSEVAELQAALAAPGSGTPAERAAIHLRLAEIFLAHVERQGGHADDAHPQAAAAELDAAIALDNADADLRAAASRLYAQLAEAASARGDRTTAEQHLARVAALSATNGTASPEALTQAATLVRATEALDRGDLGAARRLIAGAFGAAAVTRADAPPPRALQATVTVTTSRDLREYRLRLGAVDPAAGAALLARAASALAMQPGAHLDVTGDQLALTIPYTDSTALVALQAHLAAALPPDPELALLTAALLPRRLAWEIQPGLLGSTERYVENADLGSAWRTWEARASRLEAASQGSSEVGPANAKLARLQRAFWADDAAAWRKLAAQSRGVYRTELAGTETGRDWEAPVGAMRLLETEHAEVAPTQVAALAGVAACLVVFLVLAAWLLL